MKYILKALFLAAFIALGVGCNGESLIDTANPDINNTLKDFTVVSVHEPALDSTVQIQRDGSKLFQNDQGVQIYLEKAFVSWAGFKIISEGADEECEAGHDVQMNFSSIENLMQLDANPLNLGKQNIEGRAYCRYVLQFAPLEIMNSEIPEIHHKTIYLKGRFETSTQKGSFEIVFENPIEIANTFQTLENDELIDHPLHFHSGETSKVVTFAIHYDQWFSGIQFTESETDLKVKLLENFKESVRQRLIASGTTH